MFEIGPISEGTLKLEDLIIRVFEFLNKEECLDLDDLDYEVKIELYEYLVECIEEHCPPFTYFGSTEGDGACIGIWPHWEAIEEGILEGQITKTDSDYPDQGAYLVVNDHGNTTLIIDGKIQWEIV